MLMIEYLSMTPGGRRERQGGEPPPRFFVPAEDVRGDTVRLTGDEGHHARDVLRLNPGDVFIALDGRGAEHEAVVSVYTADGLVAKIRRTTRRSREPLTSLALAQAVIKPPKLAAVVAFGTALGVAEFIFFESARSLRRDVDAGELSHLNAVAAAAVKQSLRSVLPAVHPPVSLECVLTSGRRYDRALACVEDDGAPPLAKTLAGRRPAANRILVVVGPEGGWDGREREQAAAAGFAPLDLGPRRLRSELAAPAACALVLFAAGDLGPLPREEG